MENINLIVVFLEGLLSFLSPCILPILPIYLSILSNTNRIQLKIVMDKLTTVENPDYASPIVYSYKLKITTGGETIEY